METSKFSEKQIVSTFKRQSAGLKVADICRQGRDDYRHFLNFMGLYSKSRQRFELKTKKVETAIAMPGQP